METCQHRAYLQRCKLKWLLKALRLSRSKQTYKFKPLRQKKLKPMDLIKAVIATFGETEVDKKLGKEAIKQLINSGKCVYTYFGGSFIEIPHREGAAND